MFQQLNGDDLMNIEGGGKISEFFKDVGGILPDAVNGFASAAHEMAGACYDAGKDFGKWLRSL